MPGALLFFGCGKLMLLYSGRAMKWTWTDEYLTDVAVMGSLLGAVRLVLHSLKRLQRVQYIRTHHNTLAVIESVRNSTLILFTALYSDSNKDRLIKILC